MRLYLRLVLFCLAVAFFGGTVVGPVIDIMGVAPDFSILSLVILGLVGGSIPATIGGFLLGLVHDLPTPSLLGLQTLCKTVLGFGLGRLRGRLVHGMPLVEATVVVLAVVAHDVVFLVIQSALFEGGHALSLITWTLPRAVYSGLMAVPLLRLADYLGLLRQED
jgi:rod shape-determining protein MreD